MVGLATLDGRSQVCYNPRMETITFTLSREHAQDLIDAADELGGRAFLALIGAPSQVALYDALTEGLNQETTNA